MNHLVLSNNKNKYYLFLILTIFIGKIFIACLFSSGYLNQIFLPFSRFFASTLEDPWEYFLSSEVIFPYPPLMLYLLAPFAFIIHFFEISNSFFINLIIKIPIFIADGCIFYLLCWFRPQEKILFILAYLLSPVILFAGYMQGHLDLIPTAFLLASVFLLLRQKIFISILFFVAALQCKTTALIALPFMLVFLFRKAGLSITIKYSVSLMILYFFASLPFIFHSSYILTVFKNPQQNFIFNSAYLIGDLNLYPTILLLGALFSHFLLYKKINSDLLLSYLNLAFTFLLIFAYPIPSWFIWVIPYLVLFLSTPYKERNEFLLLHTIFCGMYIIFFLFYYQYPLNHEMSNLIFKQTPVNFVKSSSLQIANIIFTLLSAMLAFQAYLIYRYSIRSNAIYKGLNHPIIIGISGDSGSGKSIFLKDTYDLLGQSKVTFLEGDSEHRWERDNKNWQKYTHLDPKANLLHLQTEILSRLKQGLGIFRRDYNHETGKFTQPKLIKAKDFVLIAGLHPYYLPKARKLIDIKVYLDTDEALRIHWKIKRDSEKRGYTKKQVLDKLAIRAPDREKHILPQRNFADLCFSYSARKEPAEENLTLQVKLSANIDLEMMYAELEKYPSIQFDYDYSDDLSDQKIFFSGTLPTHEIKTIALNTIPYVDELLGNEVVWQPDLRGIRQLILMASISHHMKERL